MEADKRKIKLVAMLLILMAFYEPLKHIILCLIVGISQHKLGFMLKYTNLFFKVQLVTSYPGLDILLRKLYEVSPIHEAEAISLFIFFIKTILPTLSKIALLIAGIGFFLKKDIFRKTAIIALSVLLALNAIDFIFLFRFYLSHIFALSLYGGLIYYFRHPKVKEQFR